MVRGRVSQVLVRQGELSLVIGRVSWVVRQGELWLALVRVS